MPTRDQVVQVPFVGGIDEYSDPDQLKPPGMQAMTNCVVRKSGRIEKREGFSFVADSASPNDPAKPYDSTSSFMPQENECLGVHSGQDGQKLLVASAGALFEYVGASGSKGFREVNKLPACVGTLSPVSTSGGDIIEVESMVDDTGTYRCTAWVLGVRDGQELTNDHVRATQPVDARGLYVAVQRVSDGAYLTAPVRIMDASLSDTRRVCDIRMVKTGVVPNRYWVVAFRNDYSDIQAFVVSAQTGAITATTTIVAPPGWSDSNAYYRSFDMTATQWNRVIVAWCEANSVGSSTDVNMEMFSVSAGGVFTSITTASNYIATVNATGTAVYPWSNYAARGVVLESDPLLSSNVAIAIRVMYWTPGVSPIIDGKMVVSRFGSSATSFTLTAGLWSWLHRIGYASDEQFTSSVAAVGARRLCQSASGTIIGNVSVAPQEAGIISGVHSDGSVQPYRVTCASDGVTWYIGQPYRPEANTMPLIEASGLYPQVPHLYPANPTSNMPQGSDIRSVSFAAAPTLGQVQIYQTSITDVSIGGAPSVFPAYANTVQFVRLNIGAQPVAYAVVAFNGAGAPAEVALYDGVNAFIVAGNPAVYNPTSFDIGTGYLGPWGPNVVIAAPATTFVMRDDLNSAAAYGPTTNRGRDVPTYLAQVTQANFDSLTGPEMCVHRWDVKNTFTGTVLAISSTSAGLFATPNGDSAFGYASPFNENNFFEVYEWDGTFAGNLNNYDGTAATTLWTAMGGPWRMVSGLHLYGGKLYCAITPSGDDSQRSTLLISLSRPAALIEVERTGKLPSAGGTTMLGADNYLYEGNQGVFVESVNMPRIAAVPLNCPRLTVVDSNSLTVGAIRQGQSVGGSDVFAIDYTFAAYKWRSMKQWGDYTIVNGGLVSAFDGVSCAEVAPLLWPQRDLTSIAYDRQATKIFVRDALTRRDFTFDGYKKPITGEYPPFLNKITRPWLAYEAGFSNIKGAGYDFMYTRWGGSPFDSYEAVYTDPRMQQVSDIARPNTGSGAESSVPAHYYGRFQVGSQMTWARDVVKQNAYAIWAPRIVATAVQPDVAVPAVSDDTIKTQSQYAPVVANGDFLVRWCYESVDGTGRVVRSAPSAACVFSIFASIQATVVGAPFPPLTEVEPGGGVTEYRYGFFVPRLELTNKLKTAASDSQRTVLQPYFTAEPFATVFYKVPNSSMAVGRVPLTSYANDLTIPRNATRGVVPFCSAPKVSGQNLGIATSNFRCFDGPQNDYNGLLTQPVLYTVGGGLDNVTPPSALCMSVHQNRLVLGGADDATVVWFSKELSPTDAPQFNDALTIQIEDGGAVTGLASMESVLVIFKRTMTWLVPGDMPDDTGANINRGYVSNALGTPVRMPHGIGCVDHRSVIATPVGVFFKSDRTIELLGKDMSITPIGLKLDDTLAQRSEVCAAIHNPKDTEVWFALRVPGTTNSPLFAVYNYQADVWSTHATAGGGSFYTTPMTIMDGNVYFASEYDDGSNPIQGIVYKQTENKFFDVTPIGRSYVPMSWRTAPLAVNNVQGFQRLKRLRVFGNPIPTLSTGATQTRDPHGAQFAVQTDYAASGINDGAQTATWTEAEATDVYNAQGREVYEVHLREQKGQAVTLQYTETAPANLSTLQHGYGTAFSNMSFVVGLKAGLDKRITSGAKH